MEISDTVDNSDMTTLNGDVATMVILIECRPKIIEDRYNALMKKAEARETLIRCPFYLA